MPTLATAQLPPPKHWEEFEEMCADLFAAEWGDRFVLRYGRQGQEQHGVDIFGSSGRGERMAVQCKGKSLWPPTKLTRAEIDREVVKAQRFRPRLKELIIATTAPNDRPVTDHAKQISARHRKKGLFRVHIMGWGELCRRLTKHETLMEKHYQFVGFALLRATVRGMPRRLSKVINSSLQGERGRRFDSTAEAGAAIAGVVRQSLEKGGRTTLHFIGGGMMQYWGMLERVFSRDWREGAPLLLHVAMADTDAEIIRKLETRWPTRQKAYKDGLKALGRDHPGWPLTVRHRYYDQLPLQMGVLIDGKTLFVESYKLTGRESLKELKSIYNTHDRNECLRHDLRTRTGRIAIGRFRALHSLGKLCRSETIDPRSRRRTG